MQKKARLVSKKIIILLGRIISKLFSSKVKNISYKKVFFVLERPLGIGDIMMLYPFINSFSIQNPKKEIFILSDHAEFIKNNSIKWIERKNLRGSICQNSLLVFPDLNFRSSLRYFWKAKYKIGYLFSNHIYSNFKGFHYGFNFLSDHYDQRIKKILEILGLNKIRPSYKDIEKVESNISKFSLPKNFVCFAPFAIQSSRQYSLSLYERLINEIVKNENVVILGTKDDLSKKFNFEEMNNYKNLFNLVGQTSLNEAINIISSSDLLITNDSGSSHIGYLFSDNVLSIYGCVPPALRVPSLKRKKLKVKTFHNHKKNFLCPNYKNFSEPMCTKENNCSCLLSDYNEILNHFKNSFREL